MSFPQELSAVYGQTLGDVTLPTGFSWQDDASAKVGDVGRKTFPAVYIPVDTANYETVRNIEVSLDVAPAPLAEGDFSFDPSDAVYAGNPVTGRVEPAVLVEGKDYSVVYADNVNAGAASITVSGVAGTTRAQRSRSASPSRRPIRLIRPRLLSTRRRGKSWAI